MIVITKVPTAKYFSFMVTLLVVANMDLKILCTSISMPQIYTLYVNSTINKALIEGFTLLNEQIWVVGKFYFRNMMISFAPT
jgi:hypothetical protein